MRLRLAGTMMIALLAYGQQGAAMGVRPPLVGSGGEPSPTPQPQESQVPEVSATAGLDRYNVDAWGPGGLFYESCLGNRSEAVCACEFDLMKDALARYQADEDRGRVAVVMSERSLACGAPPPEASDPRFFWQATNLVVLEPRVPVDDEPAPDD